MSNIRSGVETPGLDGMPHYMLLEAESIGMRGLLTESKRTTTSAQQKNYFPPWKI